MKRFWILAVLAAVLAGGSILQNGTDVAKLQPVQLIRVRSADGEIRIETDTGDSGSGADLRSAFADMKDTASGNIFLETADHLLVDPAFSKRLPELAEYLRPGCEVCIALGEVDLEDAARYLRIHPSAVTLNACRGESVRLPVLMMYRGRMELVRGKN